MNTQLCAHTKKTRSTKRYIRTPSPFYRSGSSIMIMVINCILGKGDHFRINGHFLRRLQSSTLLANRRRLSLIVLGKLGDNMDNPKVLFFVLCFPT